MDIMLLPVALAITYVGYQLYVRNRLKIIEMQLQAKLAGWTDEQWKEFHG